MHTDKGRYTVIYEYYKARILYGFYAFGDKLPPILTLSKLFRIAPATVRSALALLEEEGYITIKGKQSTRVTYQGDGAQYRENAARYFLPRKEGIPDLIRTGRLLFGSFWEQRLRELSGDEWAEFLKELECLPPGAALPQTHLYLHILNKLGNGLILNLYWEMIRYLRFPYLMRGRSGRQMWEEVACLPQSQAIARLKQAYEAEQMLQELYRFIQEAQTEYQWEEAEDPFFRWRLDRPHPQRRYTLVSRLIREIVEGRYPAGSYLPSNSALAKEHQLGLSTVRRGIYVLNALGVTRSYQGRGTQVNAVPDPLDLTMPEVREGIRCFLESLQMMSLVIRPVLLYTLETAPSDRVAALTRELGGLQEGGQSFLCFKAVLTLIEDACPLMAMRECFRVLRELLAWGHPLALQRQDADTLHKNYTAVADRAKRLLERGDTEGFAVFWEDNCRWEAERFRQLVEAEM